MKKQYITELNNFYFFVRKYGLSSNEIAVYHALLHINNRCMWQEWFTATAAELGMLSGLKVDTVYRVRSRLKKMELIEVETRGNKRCSLYRICDINIANVQQTSNEHPMNVQRASNECPTLIDKDKDKDKEKETAAAVAASTASPNEKIHKLYEQYIGELNDVIIERLDDYTEKMCHEAVEYAIKEAVYNDTKNLSYVLAICHALFVAEVKTPKDVERRRKEFDEQKENSKGASKQTAKNADRKYIKGDTTYSDKDLFPDIFE